MVVQRKTRLREVVGTFRHILFLILSFEYVRGETLTPPYFNLAEGKNITASATCGVDYEGPELFCKLIGANSENDISTNVIQGQYCDECDPTRKDKMHPPEFAVDGMETWWQSPPLSRGMKYNEVNLTIHLGQEFHVAYVYIKMANSPRPGLWVLEKSADYGKTWQPWQYFSDSPADCETFFGRESLQPITRDDSVICSTEYSKIVPLEGGEIPISLLNNRPSANHYFNSSILQEWTRATNVRFRFLRTKNLLGHLMSVARQDPSVTRRYFYSIKDISIGGRCMCNGHADACDIPDSRDNRILLCNCKHNTCGAKCDKCCPGFEQKAWRQSKHYAPFSCEPCNCFQHSNECIYDKEVDEKHLSLDIHGKYAGGGVCQNCQHNTEGINCNKCKPRYFRPWNKQWNETDVCQPCQCDNSFSTGNCEEGTGRCECRKEFTPPNCDKCSFGYYGYPNCKPCECFLNGTINNQCSTYSGSCNCRSEFGGHYCKECAPGFYNFPECTRCQCNSLGSSSDSCNQVSGACECKTQYSGLKCDECRDGYFYSNNDCIYCDCDSSGTEPGICNKTTGKCMCKPGYGGDRCDTCILGYYGYPDCKPCNCSKIGSHGSTCSASGKCSCLTNYAGRTCDQCSPGYFSYPDCKPCECDYHGSNGVSCDQEGKCECHNNFAGQHCDMCKEGYYNFPACEDCNCHPAGVVEGFPGCGSVPAGELCKCKERVEGRICNKCKPLFWNLNINNADGCEECNCNRTGVLGGIGVCDTESGQCVCKPSVISRSCSECADGSYGLKEGNLFGCSDCGCDIGGAVSNICDKNTGKCICQSRVTGRTCKEPLPAHYFPTLYQYQYEVEEGHTPENTRVRYAHDEYVFPNYSWKGYAVFSSILQREVLQDIYIYKPSLYRMVFKFVNTNPNTVIGGIRVTPENPNDNEQYLKVQFRNTSQPAFVTVSGETGNIPKPFVMNPGRWYVSINVNQSVFLDYFVLLPEDFYLATILNPKVEKPCTMNETDLCRHYAYPNISMFDKSWGVGGFTQDGADIAQLEEWFQDTEHLQKLGVLNKVPLLTNNQADITFNISVHKTGSYVILINYVTPLGDLRTHDIQITANTKHGDETGHVRLYACPYTTMCRQVITNEELGVGIYDVDTNYITIKLHADDANVGVHSIYVIPYEEWSLDYIQPKPVCIRKNGTCVPSTYRDPPETKKIQFEREIDGELAKNRPVTDTGVWLTPSESSLDMRGKVISPGYYSFILHYYQPNLPAFDLDVIIQNGQFYEAKVPVSHCPSESGCRSLITQADKNNKFSLTENFMITLKQPENKNVFLDSILVVPADLYNEQNLEEESLDRTGEFIATCGKNNFDIDTSQEGFCRDSVFSITAAHNSGALTCQCDYAGSLSFECEKFGGQCKCKDHIIGRRCEACKTGYYGFPNCKPCNCPSTAYCEPSSGQCICPTHVTGEKCDQCEPLTFGYDPIIGCQECKCHPLGVDGSSQCDLLSGECPCKENVVGRPCDQCKDGHYSFPFCDSCECDYRGTTSKICDQVTAECFCKKNVVGLHCDFCREGSFNLQEQNEEGCTECFCFGKTTRCTSSNLVKIAMISMKDWEVVTVNTTESLNVTKLNLTVVNVDGGDVYSNEIGVDFSNFNVSEATGYLSAPRDYLGKKLTSYGGYLNYTIYYVIGQEGSAVSGPDVIIQGADTYLTYSNFEQPPQATEFITTLQLVESNFELPSGAPARREHVMEVLKDVRGIYLRATYWTASLTTRLMNVMQDEAIEPTSVDRNTPFALSVEQCLCPPNYQGLSCEACAPGYYRIQSGPHGGFCAPCECHGHATECDVNTGVCINCMHNTRGDHCELCDVGYHGNALAGTPRDCLICACPLPMTSNNFATTCDVSSDGEKISCECKDGYIGGRCQSCAPGFYGRPETPGDFCKPCQCSGNINPDDPSSCDTVTGDCLRCLNNTFGESCSLCRPGFYGDAVMLKDCQPCICDEFGTDHCDSYSGTCVCRPNVIGEKCDRCQIHHYGFQSGQGCSPCNCAEASDSEQCDDVKGQCMCKPGVTGRACDRCAAGYWNYTSEGCISCGCKNEYSLGFGCNALTGQCECLQGVIGEKCDQCPHRWAFVPEFGCHQCDSCHHALLDDTDALALMIDPIIFEFDSTQSGYFTRRRLESMREQLENLRPKFDEVDPKQISLNATIQELERLEQDSKNLNRKSNYSLENSDALKNQSTKLKDALEFLNDEIYLTDEEASKTIEDIEKITGELHQETTKEVAKALQEGQALFEAIKSHNLTGREEKAKKQLEKVEDLLKNVTNYKLPVQNLQKEVDMLKKNLKDFNGKLDDLYNHTQYSLNTAKEAQNIISKSGKDRLKSKLDNVEKQVSQSKINLDESDKLLTNASELLQASIGLLKQLQDTPANFEQMNNKFNDMLNENAENIENVKNLTGKVQSHVTNLTERVQQLEHILSQSQFGSEDAIKAARAYKDIVAAVRSAREAADSAQNNTNDAADILYNVQEKTNDAEIKSSKGLDSAHERKQSTDEKLKPQLSEAIERYKPVKEVHDENENVLRDVEKILDNIAVTNLEKSYKMAADNANDASQSIGEVDNAINTTFVELPRQTNEARSLAKELDDLKRDLVQTAKHITTTNETLPVVLDTMNSIPEAQSLNSQLSNEIESNVNKLNQQIELARDLANRIKVGVAFSPSTYLELRNPKNIEDLVISTKFSGYFKTKKENGFLFYIGNPNGTNLPKTKTDDYMALMIQSGHPVLKMDIGNGVEQVVNPKNVSDGNWYQYIVERVGHTAKLTIREELPNGTVTSTVAEQQLLGPLMIFNLDKEKSKIFVGGFPSKYDMQNDVRDFNSFQGEVEEVVVGNTPVSLWNFVDGYNNYNGSVERNKLEEFSPSTGFRFNGNGYIIIDARAIALRHRTYIQLSFKTFAPTGLLFLAGKENTFMSLEIRNGKVLYQYNLGGETKKWVTYKTYNDGVWHKVTATREGARGTFEVDGEKVPDKTRIVTGTSLNSMDTISFGGYPNKHNYKDVTSVRYDGCISNVTVMDESIDLRSNIKAYDVTPGCPDKFAPMVSFRKTGYVSWDRLSIANRFNATLKFKTEDSDGFIFYVANTAVDDQNFISLALRNGHLVLTSQNIELESKETFNDSLWHVVSVTHDNNTLRMVSDDYGFTSTDNPPPALHILYATIYVGSLPKRIKLQPNRVASSVPFNGCIGDLTVNGQIKNFANTTDSSKEILDKCILDTKIDVIDTVPELERTPPPPIYTTQPVMIATENPDAYLPTIRGDGGRDAGTIAPPPVTETVQPAPPQTIAPQIRGPIGTVPPTTPKPPPREGCALSPNPVQESESIVGFRFGTQQESRLEYNTPRGKYKKSFDFRLEFRTKETDGILFYVSNAIHEQFAAVYLSEGHVVFTFKGEHDPVVIKSNNAYNDDAWHMVELNREASFSKLVIDEKDISDSTHRATVLDVSVPFYVGGIVPDSYNQVETNLNTTTSFNGCMRGISMNSKPLEHSSEYGIIPCSDNVEVGTFFGGDSSTYIKLRERFRVGDMFNIRMDIKPRVNSGLLVAAHGKKDFYVLELDNGELKLTVENGRGPVTTTFRPKNKFHLCDGQWHNIQAVKSKNVVTLSVDNVFTDPRIGPSHSTSTDTRSALFLGGHKVLSIVRGIVSRAPFIGCIKNVEINNEPIQLTSNMVYGNITLGFCPTN